MNHQRMEQIEAVIAECEAKGIAWTNLLIYEEVGGQYQAVSRYLKQRRARQEAATTAAVDEDPAAWADTCPQATPDACQELEEDEARAVQACSFPEPIPTPEASDEPLAPAAVLPPSRPVPRLEVLEEAAREADAILVRLNRERDVQQQVAQMAALALYQARREARQVVGALRATVRQAQATRAPYQQEAQARVEALYAQLAELVGAADAERIANDSHFMPSWLRG